MFEWEAEPNFLKFKYFDILVEIKRHSLGFFLGYILVDKNNALFGKTEDDLIPLFKDIVEITYAEFRGSNWIIGIDFGHISDYIPNEPISESIVSTFKGFYENKIEDDFFVDFEAWCQNNKAQVSDYKNIEYVSKKMEKMAEKAQEYQSRMLN